MTTSETSQHTHSYSKQPVIGVLLVHGFNGTRQDLTDLETMLQDHGMVTHNMILPGHGTHRCRYMSRYMKKWQVL